MLPLNKSNNVDKLDKLHYLKNDFRLQKQRWYSILKNVALQKDSELVISTKIISEHIHGWYIQKVAKAFIVNTMQYFLRL